MLKNVLAAALGALVLLRSLPALATPFVDVTVWWKAQPSPWFGIPAGITISCRGEATGSGQCSDALTLQRTTTESAAWSMSSTGGLVLLNSTSHPITGFAEIEIWFSAFNPAGPRAGLGIESPEAQGARFWSSVTGDGNVMDRHSCSLGTWGSDGAQFPDNTCGVESPDMSVAYLGADLLNFMPGDEIVFSWTSAIGASFDLAASEPVGVPEPDWLMLVGALACWRLRRARALGARTRSGPSRAAPQVPAGFTFPRIAL